MIRGPEHYGTGPLRFILNRDLGMCKDCSEAMKPNAYRIKGSPLYGGGGKVSSVREFLSDPVNQCGVWILEIGAGSPPGPMVFVWNRAESAFILMGYLHEPRRWSLEQLQRESGEIE